MTWLRRLIPWAFRHDMDLDPGTPLWQTSEGMWLLRFNCKRCGFRSPRYEFMDHADFSRWLHKRGCRGAP